MKDSIEPSLQKAITATVSILAQNPNRAASLVAWADQYLIDLGKSDVGFEIQELLRAGCKRVPLAATLICATILARVPTVYLEDSKRLALLAAQLEATASIFDNLAADIPIEIPGFALGKTPKPSQMASQLRAYKLVATFVPKLIQLSDVRKSRDIERHLPTAYVKDATGDWHDREVATLISAATGADLDEGAHRVWRNRNFSTISLPFGLLWTLLEQLGEAHNKTQ